MKIVYFAATVKTPDHFDQILTWTLPSQLSENEPVLNDVINSFRSAQ